MTRLRRDYLLSYCIIVEEINMTRTNEGSTFEGTFVCIIINKYEGNTNQGNKQ